MRTTSKDLIRRRRAFFEEILEIYEEYSEPWNAEMVIKERKKELDRLLEEIGSDDRRTSEKSSDPENSENPHESESPDEREDARKDVDEEKSACQYCGEEFSSKGVAVHERSCEENPDFVSASERRAKDIAETIKGEGWMSTSDIVEAVGLSSPTLFHNTRRDVEWLDENLDSRPSRTGRGNEYRLVQETDIDEDVDGQDIDESGQLDGGGGEKSTQSGDIDEDDSTEQSDNRRDERREDAGPDDQQLQPGDEGVPRQITSSSWDAFPDPFMEGISDIEKWQNSLSWFGCPRCKKLFQNFEKLRVHSEDRGCNGLVAWKKDPREENPEDEEKNAGDSGGG